MTSVSEVDIGTPESGVGDIRISVIGTVRLWVLFPGREITRGIGL